MSVHHTSFNQVSPIAPGAAPPAYVLFFSGGKDSYMALRRAQRSLQKDAQVVLLTTFGMADGAVGHQQVPFWEVIVPQATSLGLDLLAVPLDAGPEEVPAPDPAAMPRSRYARNVHSALQVCGLRRVMTDGDWQ